MIWKGSGCKAWGETKWSKKELDQVWLHNGSCHWVCGFLGVNFWKGFGKAYGFNHRTIYRPPCVHCNLGPFVFFNVHFIDQCLSKQGVFDVLVFAFVSKLAISRPPALDCQGKVWLPNVFSIGPALQEFKPIFRYVFESKYVWTSFWRGFYSVVDWVHPVCPSHSKETSAVGFHGFFLKQLHHDFWSVFIVFSNIFIVHMSPASKARLSTHRPADSNACPPRARAGTAWTAGESLAESCELAAFVFAARTRAATDWLLRFVCETKLKSTWRVELKSNDI